MIDEKEIERQVRQMIILSDSMDMAVNRVVKFILRLIKNLGEK
jgi:hypothetical protein